jgi:hypothetical protein
MPDFTIFLHYISYWQTQTLHNTRINPSHYILTSQIKPFTTATLEKIHLSCHKYQRQHLKHKQRSDNWIKISQRETAALITEEKLLRPFERPRFSSPDFPPITGIRLFSHFSTSRTKIWTLKRKAQRIQYKFRTKISNKERYLAPYHYNSSGHNQRPFSTEFHKDKWQKSTQYPSTMDPNILGNKGDLHIPGPQLTTSVFNIIYKNN